MTRSTPNGERQEQGLGARSVWTPDYIDDAASARYVIYRDDGSIATDDASNYETPENGVHLCGQTDDGEQPTTVAAYDMPPNQARVLFLLAKEAAECSKDEADFVVDLCIDDSIEEDFWSNRQLWPRAIAAWNETPSTKSDDRGAGS